jgi:ribose transport system substrate-binding protein
MKTVRKLVVFVALVSMMGAILGCSGSGGSTASSGTGSTARTVVAREDAIQGGASLTPSSFTTEQLPGVPHVGAVPLKRYKIAFSNGDMADSWRAAFYNDMISSLQYLEKTFGITYITANSGADSAKQIEDIRSLLAQEPDILIFSPNEAAPLAVVAELCEDVGVPFITVDRAITATIGEGMYIANIESDNYKIGVAMGISIVDALTKKYGEPKGIVAEITGAVGASPSFYRSGGARNVLKDYPNIQIVQVLDGGYDDAMAYTAAQDIFTTNGSRLDLLFCSFDTGAGQAMQVAQVMGYRDVIYVASNGNSGFLKDYLLPGKAYSVIENPPYFGIIALEYAIHYLNGNDIPRNILQPQRLFSVETPEKQEALAKIVDLCVQNGDPYVPGAYGYYDIFTTVGPLWDKYYPINYIQAGGQSWLDRTNPSDPYVLWNVK